jgi:hypothetical protein
MSNGEGTFDLFEAELIFFLLINELGYLDGRSIHLRFMVILHVLGNVKVLRPVDAGPLETPLTLER